MFNKLDIFGSQILLRFKGDHTYSTKCGSFFTLLIVGVISFRLFFIVQDVFQRSSPQVIYSERQVDDPALFLMTNQTFPLAFGMQNPTTYDYYIDETIYSIKAYWQQKTLVYNATTQDYDSVWQKQNLKLQPCTAQNFGNLQNQHYYLKLKYENMYCFPPDLALAIQGDFNSEIYSQVRINVSKCTGTKCQSDDILKKQLEKSTFAMQMSDVYIDPTLKSNPFKSFSRDLFWATSTKLPKDVNIYLRNNYIYSDFGWVMEDIQTTSFPSFSFYEMSVYPESYQTYFLQVLFRFEKQKESVYQRKYKNFNSIVSEIGGFTQSLLAIGILICSRVSQLHLNQEIINQAFNYQDSSDEQIDQQENQEVDDKSMVKKTPQQSVINQVKGSYNRVQILSPKDYSSPLQQFANQNENLLQLSDMRKGQDSCNVSMQQDAYQNNPSQLSSFNKNSQKKMNTPKMSAKILSPQKFLGGEQVNVGRDQKQILNYLLSDQELISERPQISPQFIDNSSPQQEKIEKLKQQIQEEEQKAKENRFNNLMEKQSKSMKMSVWEYLKSIVFPFGKLKQKQRIINYSIDKLYYNLDIFNIVKRLIEVEKLKRLLLDQDQIKLFDYLPKPTIHSDFVLNQMKSTDKNEVDVLYQDNRTEMQKAKDAFLAYKKIIQKQQNSVLDQKIIDLLDPNLVAIFQAQSHTPIAQNIPSLRQENLKLDSSIQQQPQDKYIENFQNEIQSLKDKILFLQNQSVTKDIPFVKQDIPIETKDIPLAIKNIPMLLTDIPQAIKQESVSTSGINSQQQSMLQLRHISQIESRKESNQLSYSLDNQGYESKNYNLQQQLKELEDSEIAIEQIQQYPRELLKYQKSNINEFQDHLQ